MYERFDRVNLELVMAKHKLLNLCIMSFWLMFFVSTWWNLVDYKYIMFILIFIEQLLITLLFVNRYTC